MCTCAQNSSGCPNILPQESCCGRAAINNSGPAVCSQDELPVPSRSLPQQCSSQALGAMGRPPCPALLAAGQHWEICCGYKKCWGTRQYFVSHKPDKHCTDVQGFSWRNLHSSQIFAGQSRMFRYWYVFTGKWKEIVPYFNVLTSACCSESPCSPSACCGLTGKVLCQAGGCSLTCFSKQLFNLFIFFLQLHRGFFFAF